MKNISNSVQMVVILSLTHFCVGAQPENTRPDEVGQTGLVLHYDFDNRTDQAVANQLGRQHEGKSNKALFRAAPSGGTALFVHKDNVKSGYVETANHPDFNGPAFTVSAWIKLRRINSHGSVVCKHDWLNGKARGFVLRCNTYGWGTSSTKPNAPSYIGLTVGAGGWVSIGGKTRFPVNQWSHVAGTFDGAKIRVFVNGQLEGTNEVKKAYTPSPFPLRIGHAAYALERPRKFDGQIDDVMIWKRALTEKEMQAIFDDQRKSRPSPLTAKDIAPLIKQLGAKDFDEREKASKRLIELDTEVIPLLKPHRQSDDAEIAWRVKRIEKAIEQNLGR